jgi:hypothetical protein
VGKEIFFFHDLTDTVYLIMIFTQKIKRIWAIENEYDYTMTVLTTAQ